MIKKRNMITKGNASSSGMFVIRNDKPSNMVVNTSKPKHKIDVSEFDRFKCGGKRNLARYCDTKSDSKTKQHSNFSISWDESYGSGDDMDVSFVENQEFAHVTRCLVAKLHDVVSVDSEVYSDDDCFGVKPINVDYKTLYMIECSRNNNLWCTISNLRSKINEMNSKIKDLKHVYLNKLEKFKV